MKELKEFTLKLLQTPIVLTLPNFFASWFHLLVVFCVVFIVYALTMPHTVTMEDSGFFIMSASCAGVNHPPGYPLYSLLGKIFTLIPVGSIAFRVNCLSGFFGALSCSLVWWILFAIGSQRERKQKDGALKINAKVIAYLGAFSLGFSRTFWSQALIAEVYTLNVFLFLTLFILAMYFCVSGCVKTLLCLAFVYGLSLTNHWPLIQLAVPALFVLVIPRLKLLLQNVHKIAFLFLLGLTPYVYMYFRSQHEDLFFSFHGPMNTLDELWYHISRKHYKGLENSGSVTWLDKYHFMLYLCKQLFQQFGILGGLLAIVGVTVQWKQVPKLLSLALIIAFLGNSFLLVLLLHFDFDYFFQEVFRVYPLVSYAVMSVWISLGFKFIFDQIIRSENKKKTLLTGTIVVLFVANLFYSHISINNRKHDRWAADYAVALLNSLPKNAIYFTGGDYDLGPVGYMHHLEGVRPDVTLYNDGGTGFSNRLFSPRRLNVRLVEGILKEFYDKTNRDICYHHHAMINPYQKEWYGLYMRVNKDENAVESFRIKESVIPYFKKIVAQDSLSDFFSDHHRRLLVGKFAVILTNLVYSSDDPRLRKKFQPLLDLAGTTYIGKLRTVETLLYMRHNDYKLMWQLLEEGERLVKTGVSKRNLCKLPQFKAMVMFQQGKMKEYEQYLHESIDMFPNKENNSIRLLYTHYIKTHRIAQAESLKKEYPHLSRPFTEHH